MGLKTFLLDGLARWKFGTSRPEIVVPPGSPSNVALNPADRRALKKLVYDSARNRVSVPMVFWRDCVAHLQPDTALDVGANYGECFSSTLYPSHTRVVAVEANPTLIPFLEKTRNMHPAVAQIVVVNCLVADQKRGLQPFFYDPQWTGGGSAVVELQGENHVQVDLPVDTIDGILESLSIKSEGSLLFKVDIEGYEGMMLKGFRRLGNFRRVAGILEFDTLMLEKAGTPAEPVFNMLAEVFKIFNTTNRSHKLRALSCWKDLVEQFTRSDFHTDLVIAKTQNDLPPTWKIHS